MEKPVISPYAHVLKWIVFALILLNITALCTLNIWLSALYDSGSTALLGGGYFIPRGNYLRTDYNQMFIFLGACGAASLGMLIFAFRILSRLCAGALFHRKNADDLKYMAFGALFIMIMGIIKAFYVFTLYGTLFIGVFMLAAIFLLVLSQIFAEASRIKEDNDLVI